MSCYKDHNAQYRLAVMYTTKHTCQKTVRKDVQIRK